VSDPVAIAREAWGEDPPDWVLRLAEECARSSQVKVAARLERSGATVSQVLRNKYAARLDAFEEVVRGVLMNATVQCPALGEISTAQCRQWMGHSRTYTNANSERVRMYRACRRCPRLAKEGS